jgi:hypothetical protein
VPLKYPEVKFPEDHKTIRRAMTPQELEQHLIAQLNALPTEENRLLYDIDYDKHLVIETAKNLLVHNPFPLLPRLNAHRLTILAAFALAMADDEYAELDSFYNRLSDIFFANAPLMCTDKMRFEILSRKLAISMDFAF